VLYEKDPDKVTQDLIDRAKENLVNLPEPIPTEQSTTEKPTTETQKDNTPDE